MRHAIRIGRLSILANGLGIGAVLASLPGAASADSSTDPLSWLDELVSGVSIPTQAASTLDMQISINGLDLFPTAGNTAVATSSLGNIAIAIGNGASANANGGSFGSGFGLVRPGIRRQRQ